MKTTHKTLPWLLAAAAAFSTARAGDEIVLRSPEQHGGAFAWRMIQAGTAAVDGAKLSQPGFAVEDWKPAVVPGTVLNSLVRNGAYPEPYFGINNASKLKKIPELSEAGREFYTYWFRTEFELTPAFAGKRVLLELDGVNYRAQVWFNGAKAGELAGMFQRGWFDVTDLARREGKNALAILVEPPDTVGGLVQKAGNEGAVGENSNGGDRTFGKNVTMLMSVGWDFTIRDGVRDRNTGLWRDVKVVPSGPVALRHPFVRSRLPLPALAPARTTVSVEAINLTKEPQTGVLRGRIPGANATFEQKVDLKPGETRGLVFAPDAFPALTIKEPRLWWPLNKGPQNLYDLELEFVAAAGAVSDRAHTRFGIREITSDLNTPDQSRIFYVNGRRLFIRGSNWIPEAMCRGSEARTYAELRMTAQAGVNLLRQWGGGITESDYFYDLCDELGILVWTEFWLTGNTDLPDDPALYRANITDTVKRIRNHPSQAYYVSANERDAKGIVPIADLLEQLDGTRGYQPGSETDGIHDGSPYISLNPMWYYEDSASARGSRINGFNPEYGCPCLPTIDALREMMDERDLWPVNRQVWDYLDGGGFHRVASDYLRGVMQYGPVRNAEDLATHGQAYGALCNRAIWECWSRNKFEYGDRFSSGFLFWYHNSPVRQVCGRMWDWSLEPTASLFYTQKANEPLHPQFDFLKDTVSVVNEWPQPFAGGRVSVRVLNFDLAEVFRHEAPVTVAADAVTNDLIRVEWPANLTPVHFLKLELRDAAGKLVGDNFYWRSNKAYTPKATWTGPQFEGFEQLCTLAAVAPDVRVTEGRRAPFATRTVTVKNPTPRLAFMTWLRLQHADTGKPVRPAFYSDNFFCLLPGEEKTVTIEYDEAVSGAKATRIMVDGWNVRRQIWNAGRFEPAAVIDGLRPLEVTGRAPTAELALDGGASGAPGAKVAQYKWTLDGRPAGGQSQTRLQLAVGRHTVGLEIVTDDGRTATATAAVDVTAGRIERGAFSSGNETPGRTADMAIDGTADTRWSSPRTNNQWIAVDLGEPRRVAAVVLDWEAAYAKEYKVQVSTTKTNWVDVVYEKSGGGGREVQYFPAVEARYVRMYGVKRATEYGFSLWEMTVLPEGVPPPNR